MDDFKRETVAVALRELFEQGFFSICDFNKIAKLIGVHVDEETQKHLDALHCVHYSKMRPGFRRELAERVVKALDCDGIPEVRVTATGVEVVERPRLGFVRRILTGGGKP